MPAIDERVERLTSIPDEDVDELIKGFEIDGAIKILKERQPDGLWTLTAYFEVSEEEAAALKSSAAKR